LNRVRILTLDCDVRGWIDEEERARKEAENPIDDEESEDERYKDNDDIEEGQDSRYEPNP
jgi:hypothetical protein